MACGLFQRKDWVSQYYKSRPQNYGLVHCRERSEDELGEFLDSSGPIVQELYADPILRLSQRATTG